MKGIKLINGTYALDFQLSQLERKLFREFEDKLDSIGFKYLSIPTTVRLDTIKKQEVIPPYLSYRYGSDNLLAGSAEQGILQYFANSEVEPMYIYAKNQCFRNEEGTYACIRLYEFLKLEQFCFTTKEKSEEDFDLLLRNATEFLEKYEIKHRVLNVTHRDCGYHIKKYDIEIYSKTYDWIETHSCTYFGEEQTKRFGITGATHTISNTGLASPRILIPFLEKL
jgi:seryl-tRNA synthetase